MNTKGEDGKTERQGERQEGDGERDGHRRTQREVEQWIKEARPAEKGKGKGPGKKNEDRQRDTLEKKTVVRSGSAWAARTQVQGGQGREGSKLIQSQSWTCMAQALGQWSKVRSHGISLAA